MLNIVRIRLTTASITVVLLLSTSCGGGSGGFDTVGGSPVDDGTPGAGTDIAVAGTLVTNQRDWFDRFFSASVTNSELDGWNSPIEISLPAANVRTILSGKNPWRHPSGKTLYMVTCGVINFQTARQVALYDPSDGSSTIISACSEVIANPGASETYFDFAQLSPDEQTVAVVARYYLNDRWQYAVLVYDVSNPNQEIAIWDDSAAPTWTPDGQLLMAYGNAFRQVDQNMNELATLLMDDPNARVDNPDVDPSGQFIVFEYNLDIWIMNIDGSGQRPLVSSDYRWRFPTWSPDGSTIAYLGLHPDADWDQFDQSIYFTDVSTETHQAMSLQHNWPGTATLVPSGPMSWVAP